MESFDKNQKGSVSKANTVLNFDNNININIRGIAAFADATFDQLTDKLSAKFSLSLLSQSILEVKQDTTLTNYPNGVGSSKENLDLIYEVRGQFNYDINSFLDLGFETRYKFLPMKYSLQLAKSNNTFETQNYNVEEKIIYNAINIYFKTELLGLFRPTIGYSSEKTEGINKLNNVTYSKTTAMILFGFNNRF